jgi:hypothetical protein
VDPRPEQPYLDFVLQGGLSTFYSPHRAAETQAAQTKLVEAKIEWWKKPGNGSSFAGSSTEGEGEGWHWNSATGWNWQSDDQDDDSFTHGPQ